MVRKKGINSTIFWISLTFLIIVGIIGISLAIYYGLKDDDNGSWSGGGGGGGGAGLSKEDLLRQLQITNDKLEYEKHIRRDKQDTVKEKFSYPIYYINLERSPERREFMEKQFNDIGIMDKVTRIDAIDGKKIENDIVKGEINKGKVQGINYIVKNTTDLTKSELCCTLSHFMAIKTAYEKGDEVALILEDDAYLGMIELWSHSLKEYVKRLPEDWECIQLYSGNYDFKKSKNMYSLWNKKTDFTTVSYLINRNGMKKILNKFFVPTTDYRGLQAPDGNLTVVFVENKKSKPNYNEQKIYNTFVADYLIFYLFL